MKKLTQRDLCVLFLAERGGWIKAHELQGKIIRGKMLGSQSDRRILEVMDIIKDPKGPRCYDINGVKYVLEEGTEGKFKTYRVLGAHRTIQEVVQLFTPDGRPYVQLIEKRISV